MVKHTPLKNTHNTKPHYTTTMPEIPEPPTDVHYIHGETGEDTLCDLQYEGANENGQHLWNITNDISFEPSRGDTFKIAKMPAHTGISFPAGKITPGI